MSSVVRFCAVAGARPAAAMSAARPTVSKSFDCIGGSPSVRASAAGRRVGLGDAVVHDGDARMGGVDHDLRVRGIDAVMQAEEGVDAAEPVVRAHQLELL